MLIQSAAEEVTVRVAGYVRESADPGSGKSAYAQQEEIRRHATEHGDHLVAVCQDVRVVGEPGARDGYLGLLGVIASQAVDAVVVPGVGTLSSDQIVQEIMLWDLRARGVRVISTDAADLPLLDTEAEPGPARMLIRDVLARVGEHARGIGSHRIEPPGILADGDVLVHIIHADRAEERRADASSR
ncbi:MAG TPA: recombinase family protein [Acidimicrobiia bacterium]